MDLITLIKTRRTIHRYLDRKVDESIVDQALEAAHFAPNHKLTWPWRFTKVGPITKSKIDAAALMMKSANGPLEGKALEIFQQKRIYPGLIVASQIKHSDPFQSKEDYAAVSCAIQNLSLVFHGQGVGCKWSTGSLIRSPRAYDLLEIDPHIEEIVGFLWYGYAAHHPKIKRPELSEVIRCLE